VNAGMKLQSLNIYFDGIKEAITQSCALALKEPDIHAAPP